MVQNDDGLFLKLNDATFTRSSIELGRNAAANGWGNFIPLTVASDCSYRWATSTADLTRTNIKFSPSILPYRPAGYNAEGKGVLSSDNQVLTITSKGYCAHTYYKWSWYMNLYDNHKYLGNHLIPVTF